jgi:hypothetical protein
MRISEAKLKAMQSQGAIVKREPKPLIQLEPEKPDQNLEVQRNLLASQLAQSAHLAEIVQALRDQSEYRSDRVRLKVNRDKQGLIETIDVERL